MKVQRTHIVVRHTGLALKEEEEEEEGKFCTVGSEATAAKIVFCFD